MRAVVREHRARRGPQSIPEQAMRGTAAEVLTPTGAIVPATASVDDAERRLVTLGVSQLYVLGPDGQLAGVLPDYDVLKHRIVRDGRTPCVADVMSRIDISASCATPLRELALHMRQSSRARIPVVANGRLIGEVTRTNVLLRLRHSDPVDVEATPEPVETRPVPPAGPKFLRSGSSPAPSGDASMLAGIAITR
jgi:CBS domain-containing protein